MKKSDNTPLIEIDRILTPSTSTMIDRYVYANHWTKGKTVIDAACGQGYGSMILFSLGATSVTGIDIDESAISDANNRWKSDNISFHNHNIFELTSIFENKSFDVATSIETFEHLPPDLIDSYLQQLKLITREKILITTPKRKTKNWEYNGGTHLYEYDDREFRKILFRNFGEKFELNYISEIQLPQGQWGTDITSDISLTYPPHIIFFAEVTL